MKDLSSALERLRVAFATPTPGLGAPGPAEEGDQDMGDADGTERATPPEEAQTPPTKRLKGFVAASQKATSQANKPVTLVPVDGKPGYFKLVDLPDLGPVSHHPGLPLRVVAAVKRTGIAGQARIHLLNDEGTAVGCGWRPAASKIQELSVQDYMSEPEAYGKCERCFKRYGLPADWVLEPAEVPTLQEDSEFLADSGSETDDSVDTQSETEVVALPLEA